MTYNFSVVQKECEKLFDIVDVSKLKNQKILITGASGLIGSFFADFFNYLNENHQYNIEIFLTSFGSSTGLERIKHLIDKNNIKYFSWDASKEIEESKIDKINYVFFCSGYGQPAKFTKDNVKTAFINTVGLNSILRCLEKRPDTNLLFISSSEIYGNPDENNIPTKETYNGSYSIENNRASYICSKRLGEIICLQYKEKINIKIARVGLIYGPGTLSNDDRVLQNFIFKAHKDKKIKMLDDGSAIRNYLYLLNGAEIILKIFLHGNDIIYNVGGDSEPTSILEIANIISNYFEIEVEKGEELKNDIVKNSPKNVYLSMEKYKKEFNVNLKDIINLKEGIKAVILWYNFWEI
jgi:dTDP-glucose 4,6-dehydratase/UDP-glucuronate decarboxylase